MHPSGLTWERWHWPFKTPEERAIIEQWRNFNLDETIPF